MGLGGRGEPFDEGFLVRVMRFVELDRRYDHQNAVLMTITEISRSPDLGGPSEWMAKRHRGFNVIAANYG
jgi:hypothetical protein